MSIIHRSTSGHSDGRPCDKPISSAAWPASREFSGNNSGRTPAPALKSVTCYLRATQHNHQ